MSGKAQIREGIPAGVSYHHPSWTVTFRNAHLGYYTNYEDAEKTRRFFERYGYGEGTVQQIKEEHRLAVEAGELPAPNKLVAKARMHDDTGPKRYKTICVWCGQLLLINHFQTRYHPTCLLAKRTKDARDRRRRKCQLN